jgi:hypothetical protein
MVQKLVGYVNECSYVHYIGDQDIAIFDSYLEMLLSAGSEKDKIYATSMMQKRNNDLKNW